MKNAIKSKFSRSKDHSAEVANDNNSSNHENQLSIENELMEDDALEEMTREQGQKFFYQQFLDCSDILAALVIVLVLRSFDDNIVSDLDRPAFLLFIYESGVELLLDFLFTIITPFLVMKWSVLKNFHPIRDTKGSFKNNLFYFTVSSLLIFPLFIFIMFNLPQNNKE